MKAGTAQKLVLNMISTTAMIRSGKVYSNLMVDLQASNEKLKVRALRIIQLATGCSRDEAEEALGDRRRAKPAIVMILAGCSAEEAHRLLEEAGRFCPPGAGARRGAVEEPGLRSKLALGASARFGAGPKVQEQREAS